MTPEELEADRQRVQDLALYGKPRSVDTDWGELRARLAEIDDGAKRYAEGSEKRAGRDIAAINLDDPDPEDVQARRDAGVPPTDAERFLL